MHVMELVLQGVRRFNQSRKFPLKPGFNVVYGPTETGKTTLVDCLLDLLFPDRVKDDDTAFLSWGEVDSSRAGLTISSGREVYRVLKDYKSERVSLTHYSPATKKFEPVAADAAQAAAMLNSTLALPSFNVYRSIFISSTVKMPSALPLTPPDDDDEDPVAGPGLSANPDMTAPLGPGGQQAPPMGMPGAAMPGAMMPGMPGAAMPGAMMPGMPGAAMPGAMMPGMPGAAMPGAMMPGMPGAAMPGAMMPGMPGTMPGMGGMPGMSGMPGMGHGMDDGMTPEEREKRVVKIREELQTAEKVEEIQYEIDGYQQKIFDVESKKKNATQFDEFLNQAKEQLDVYKAFKRLPEKIFERLDRYKDLVSIQGQEIDKIDKEALVYDEELGGLKSFPPIFKQQYFLIGVGLFVGAIASFFLYQRMDIGPLLYVAVLGLLGGVGLTAVTGWMHIDRMGKKATIEEKLDELNEKRQSVIKRFEVETAVIDKLMNDSDSDTPEELRAKLEKYQDLSARYESVLERKNKLIAELDMDALEKKEKELRSKIEECENQLRKYPSFSGDAMEMKRELEGLLAKIKMTNPNSKVLKEAEKKAEGLGVPNLGGESSPGGTGGGTSTRMKRKRVQTVRSAPEAYEDLLKNGAALFDTERNKLLSHLQKRFDLYVQAFFGKRYVEARVDPDGSVALKTAEGNRWIDFDKLSPAARDNVYLALQITLLELAIQKRHLPIILDDAFLRLDENAATVAAKAFKRVSETSQLILLSSQRSPVQYADHTLHLE